MSGPERKRPAPATRRTDRGASPVRLVALRILEAVSLHGGNSSIELDLARFASDADRGLATEVVLGTLRHGPALDWHLRKLASRPLERMDARVLLALRLGAYQLLYLDRVPAYAAVGETVEVVKKTLGHKEASFVNGVLRSLERGRAAAKTSLPGPDDARGELTVTLGLPAFLADRWTARFGPAATRGLAVAASSRPRLVLRAVLSRGTREALVALLAEDHVVARPGRYLEESLVVEEGDAFATRAFRKGLFLVQDEAAQMVARLVRPGAGERIFDACAAPGGKSIAIADLAAGRAQVVAADARPARLVRIEESLRRVRVGGVRLLATDGAAPGLNASFDTVLVDAPCTGSGTLRRNPELRYRIDDALLAESAARARRILAGTLPLLKPGGRLIYATCSLEPEENEQVIESLLGADPTLAVVDPTSSLPATARGLIGTDRFLRTHPLDPELDGFTAVVLEKRR